MLYFKRIGEKGMKKKLLCLIFAMVFILPCFIFGACGESSSNDASGGGTNNSTTNNGGSNNGGNNASADTIDKMYDLQIASLLEKTNRHYNENNTLIRLPDGKTLAIDYVPSNLSEFEAQFGYFTNLAPSSDLNYVYEIDYYVCTTPMLNFNANFFSTVKVKNFYRPNMEIDLESWKETADKMGNLYYPSSMSIYYEDIMNLPKEYLTGRKKPYFDASASKPAPENTHNETSDMYAYYNEINNWSYLQALVLLHQQGTNIILTTDESDITSNFTYGGKEYSYTIDFTCPEPTMPQMEMSNMLEFFPKATNPNVGSWGFPENPKQYAIDINKKQDFEFITFVGISYQDFDMLYMHEPTYNAFKGFMEQHNPDKKYDLFLATHTESERHDQFDDVWKDIFKYYEEKGLYLLDLLMDKNKQDTNILIMREHEPNMFWNNLVASYKAVFTPEQQVLKLENSYKVYNNTYGIHLPVVTVKKNGEFYVEIVSDLNSYDITKDYSLLCPSFDGVREVPEISH